MAYQSVNPNTGKVLKSFEKLTDEQLEKSIAAAETCFQTWKHTTYAQRAEIVDKAATLMRKNVDEFAKLATLEMGKRIDEARGEVRFSADILAYYAEHAKTFLAPTKLNPKVGEAHMENSPFGVLFCVEPWNFPYYQLARVAGPQLMAGNVLVVKHAGCVPQCAIAFEKLLLDAGAPKGAYTNLLISHEQSERIIDDPRIKGVALTGSVEAGRSIAARAGQNLKKTSMELGGSDAFIVLDDADLEKTVPWAVWGRMYNGGQTCCAAKRFIVLDSIADKFLEQFKAALSALKPGDPPGAFDRYGFRVPAGVVSPYSKRNFVSHTIYDHTSILKTLEEKWNLPALTRRDANASSLFDMIDLHSKPAFKQPPRLPTAADPTLKAGCLSSGPGTIPPPSAVTKAG